MRGNNGAQTSSDLEHEWNKLSSVVFTSAEWQPKSRPFLNVTRDLACYHGDRRHYLGSI